MMNFATIKALSIPEGAVKKITCGENVLWELSGGEAIAFTGNYVQLDGTYDIGGAAYVLYQLTSSGTLSVNSEGVKAWLCGGGAGGASSLIQSRTYVAGGGGGGGYCANQPSLPAGEYTVVIGSGGASGGNGGSTTLGNLAAQGGYTGNYSLSNPGTGGAGGSGGGGAYNSYNAGFGSSGAGSGISTIPFSITNAYKHCAGGGGGGYSNDSSSLKKGGLYGGSNGSDGIGRYTGDGNGGPGGDYGGGNGGDSRRNWSASGSPEGNSATYYGSGGGGGSMNVNVDNTVMNGGSGYQGVAYIVVPV